MPKPTSLHPQDVLVACSLYSCSERRREWTYGSLAEATLLSVGECHRAVERCRDSGLLLPSGADVSRRMLRDVLAVAVPRIFYASRGGPSRGTPTSVHAAPLKDRFRPGDEAEVLVWPGTRIVEGTALAPIYPTVPEAARLDPVVYKLLALADVLRAGSSDERGRASAMLDRWLLNR